MNFPTYFGRNQPFLLVFKKKENSDVDSLIGDIIKSGQAEGVTFCWLDMYVLRVTIVVVVVVANTHKLIVIFSGVKSVKKDHKTKFILTNVYLKLFMKPLWEGELVLLIRY